MSVAKHLRSTVLRHTSRPSTSEATSTIELLVVSTNSTQIDVGRGQEEGKTEVGREETVVPSQRRKN
jgi:hypothetical protein